MTPKNNFSERFDAQRLHDIEARIAAAKAHLSECQLALYAEQCRQLGLDVGATVRSTKTGMLLRVTKIRFWDTGTAWITGNPQKKDGTWGQNERNLYTDWERVDGEG